MTIKNTNKNKNKKKRSVSSTYPIILLLFGLVLYYINNNYLSKVNNTNDDQMPIINHQAVAVFGTRNSQEMTRNSPQEMEMLSTRAASASSHNKAEVHVDSKKSSASSSTSSSASSASSASTSSTIPGNINYIDTIHNPTKNIRSWGCNRSETPLIFLHVGKSGGGQIRQRLAASALNYNKQTQEKWHGINTHTYYPIIGDADSTNTADNALERRGIFYNSKFPNYFHSHVNESEHGQGKDILEAPLQGSKSFEGVKFCNGTTPFGIIMGCDHPTMSTRKRKRKRKRNAFKTIECDDEYFLHHQYWKNKAIGETEVDDDAATAAAAEKLYNRKPGHTCDIVYVGHNNFGNELSWLPVTYLKEHWWDHSIFASTSTSTDKLDTFWTRLLGHPEGNRQQRYELMLQQLSNQKMRTRILRRRLKSKSTSTGHNNLWCPNGYKSQDGKTKKYTRPNNINDLTASYEPCNKPISEQADQQFNQEYSNLLSQSSGSSTSSSTSNTMSSKNKNNDKNTMDGNYSPIYASLPLHRITMIRDPWSWMLSKFFWHGIDGKLGLYDRIQNITKVNTTSDTDDNEDGVVCNIDPLENMIPLIKNPKTHRYLTWMETFAYEQLMNLCGNDCSIRYNNGLISLQEFENQVTSNLRQAFSVVGLLNETESFYTMIHQRIAYVDTTINVDVKGSKHSSKTKKGLKGKLQEACRQQFLYNETFRSQARHDLPVMAALERVYQVGLEVNRFQLEELKQCY